MTRFRVLTHPAVELLRASYGKWRAHRSPRIAAALAYYTVFSIAPLLLIAIGIAGLAFGQEAVRARVGQQLEALVGAAGAQAIDQALQNAGEPAADGIAAVIGVAILLFAAAGVFSELEAALNLIWEVEPRPRRGIVTVIRERFVSYTMVLGTGFLLLVSLVLSAGVAALSAWLTAALPKAAFLIYGADFLLSIIMVTLLFASIYKVLPDARIAWQDVWIGAAFTALLFAIGKLAIGLYLGRASVGSTYGAAGGLLVVLAWVYYSAQLVLFGAEFTRVYAQRRSAYQTRLDRGAPAPADPSADVDGAGGQQTHRAA